MQCGIRTRVESSPVIGSPCALLPSLLRASLTSQCFLFWQACFLCPPSCSTNYITHKLGLVLIYGYFRCNSMTIVLCLPPLAAEHFVSMAQLSLFFFATLHVYNCDQLLLINVWSMFKTIAAYRDRTMSCCLLEIVICSQQVTVCIDQG